MIELKNKLDGRTICTLKLKPENVQFIFNGKLQDITSFKLKKESNLDIKIEDNLKDILYDYWRALE